MQKVKLKLPWRGLNNAHINAVFSKRIKLIYFFLSYICHLKTACGVQICTYYHWKPLLVSTDLTTSTSALFSLYKLISLPKAHPLNNLQCITRRFFTFQLLCEFNKYLTHWIRSYTFLFCLIALRNELLKEREWSYKTPSPWFLGRRYCMTFLDQIKDFSQRTRKGCHVCTW